MTVLHYFLTVLLGMLLFWLQTTYGCWNLEGTLPPAKSGTRMLWRVMAGLALGIVIALYLLPCYCAQP